MKYSLKPEVKASAIDPSVGHGDDQHTSVLFGEDETILKSVSDLDDGQPEGSAESLSVIKPSLEGLTASDTGYSEQEIQKAPNISRVIDVEGNAHISIILGPLEKSRWSAQVVGMIDSASETDTIDITICANPYGTCDTYTHRSILSAIDRCKASVTTHAGVLTTIGDVAVWLSGDNLRYSKKMSFVMIRQPLTGFEGDIADYESKIASAKESWKEFSGYVAERGLFTKSELATMFETRGLLFLYGRELEARIANLKTVED